MDARTDSPATVADRPAGPAPKPARSRRTQLFIILGVVILVAALLWGVYWVLVASHHETTDDAYVDADVASVTPLVSGPIISAPATDTLVVKRGDVLATIDPADFKLALSQAEAAYGQAQRKVHGYFADRDAQGALLLARKADVQHAQAALISAQSDLSRAQTDLQRRRALAPAGAVSADELTAAENRYEQAREAVNAAEAAIAQAKANQVSAASQEQGAEALIVGADVEGNPEVASAKAKLDQARLDLDRTVIRAPIDGVVAKNTVEVGQRVQSGAQLMEIAPIEEAYVNANFKEVQLKHVRIGQPVVLTSDLYGSGVKFHGHVMGLAGGTGAAFAIIPAQNATGNWIKVVQRLPVRIALDPQELRDHPLRVGLSMNVDIDTAQ